MTATQKCSVTVWGTRGAVPVAEAPFLKTGGNTSCVSVCCGSELVVAVVGNIGSPQGMDYTAIGDTVNTAARLEANAPAGTVYISREVANRPDDRLRVTSLGDGIKLKGKAEGFEILIMEEILQGRKRQISLHGKVLCRKITGKGQILFSFDETMMKICGRMP